MRNADLRPSTRPGIGLLALALLAGGATAAAADTIYLTNGRVIHSATVRVEGDRVEFRQYGGWVVIPRSIVDRVEENERGSPMAVRPGAATTGGEPAAGSEGEEGAASGQEAQTSEEGQEGQPSEEGQEAQASEEGQEGQGEEDEAPPPEETRAYWRNRLQPLFRQMDRIEAELARYRPLAATSPDAAARVEELENQLGRVESQVESIQTEARRLGVPAGWVRR